MTLWWYTILKHLAGALSPACFFSILPAYRGCITGPVQTESCNYPDCHLIAAPLSAASPRASPFYIGHTERERDVMIAFWAGISLNFTMFLIHPIISSQCPAFSIHFSFFCRSRCDVWHIQSPLHAACFIWCQSSDCRKWRVLWCYSPLSQTVVLCLSVPSI